MWAHSSPDEWELAEISGCLGASSILETVCRENEKHGHMDLLPLTTVPAPHSWKYPPRCCPRSQPSQPTSLSGLSCKVAFGFLNLTECHFASIPPISTLQIHPKNVLLIFSPHPDPVPGLYFALRPMGWYIDLSSRHPSHYFHSLSFLFLHLPVTSSLPLLP